jgi:hypothetical protein
MNIPEKLPKMRGIGSVHLEFKRCGKPTCRCSRGLLHGPYIYRHWRENGRQRKAYIVMAALRGTFEAIERQRAGTPKIAEILRLLKGQRDD